MVLRPRRPRGGSPDRRHEAVSGTTEVHARGHNPVMGPSCGGYVASLRRPPSSSPARAVRHHGDARTMARPRPWSSTRRTATGSAPTTPTASTRASSSARPTTRRSPRARTTSGSAPSATRAAWAWTWARTWTSRPMGPTSVTVSAVRGEIIDQPADSMDDMMDARPDFATGTYNGADLQADRPKKTLTLRDSIAEATVIARRHAHQPRRRRCLRRLRRRPAHARRHGHRRAALDSGHCRGRGPRDPRPDALRRLALLG